MPQVTANYVQELQRGGWLWDADSGSADGGANLHRTGAVKGFKASPIAQGQVRITANVGHSKGTATHGVLIFLSRHADGKVMITSKEDG